MIIQLRGTSGSGKTWVVNRIMSTYEFTPVISNKGIHKGYYCDDLNLFIVGKYTTTCGGCDTVKTQDEICKRIDKAVKKGWNVLFEGLICSHIAHRYAEVYNRHKKSGVEVKYIFLSTPLDKCRQQINNRRAIAGKPPVVAKNTEKDYTSTHKSRKNMFDLGVAEEDMPIMSSKKAYAYIVRHLEEQNADCT